MDLERRVDNPDDADQYHETGGEEVDYEFQWILKVKRANKRFGPK
jgi:hypothetical protein